MSDFPSDQRLFKQHEIVHIPCIAIQEIETIEFSRDDSAILWVFTSKHASEIFLRRSDLRRHLQENDTCVGLGAKTVANLDWNRPVHIPEKEGNAKDLCRFIIDNYSKGKVVAVGGNLRSFDIAKSLNQHGFSATRLDIYTTLIGAKSGKGREFSKEEISDLKKNLKGTIAFASPSAVKGFVKVFAPRENRLSGLEAITLGQNAFELAKEHFKQVKKTSNNSLESLLNYTISK